VRWNEQNAFAMTAGENYTHEFKPEIMTSWYINKYGLQAYRNLVIKSKQRSNLKTADLLVLLKYYRNLNERER
jgi:hypothetical protein